MVSDKLNVTVVPALNIKPGDRVLIHAGADTDFNVWPHVLDQLREKFPGVEFTLLGGAEQIAVQPGGAGEQVQRFMPDLGAATWSDQAEAENQLAEQGDT